MLINFNTLPCPCSYPLPGAATPAPTPLPSAPAGLSSALLRGAASLLRASAKVADPTAAGAKISGDTHTGAGETLCRPVSPAPLPARASPAARRGAGAPHGCAAGRGAAAAPDTPTRSGLTPGLSGPPAPERPEAAPGVPPASPRSLCRGPCRVAGSRKPLNGSGSKRAAKPLPGSAPGAVATCQRAGLARPPEGRGHPASQPDPCPGWVPDPQSRSGAPHPALPAPPAQPPPNGARTPAPARSGGRSVLRAERVSEAKKPNLSLKLGLGGRGESRLPAGLGWGEPSGRSPRLPGGSGEEAATPPLPEGVPVLAWKSATGAARCLLPAAGPPRPDAPLPLTGNDPAAPGRGPLPTGGVGVPGTPSPRGEGEGSGPEPRTTGGGGRERLRPLPARRRGRPGAEGAAGGGAASQTSPARAARPPPLPPPRDPGPAPSP
ncbi:basic salivary proline-rich protein 2-like [Motacilla alba alba]|uniref:basic salivary proline-rich protein 2-like n=1 Tax=Motacilla alba alba TaxID=1094192 RepID=UPI0018D531B4|nr:basic salivary proline-rich protein 2-like [Motacilla alba alba]